MAVDSYLELFTTLFGWQWYGIIWDALSDTGIVYIPFVMIVINGWKDAARGGSYGNVHDLALRSVEIEFYVAVFVALIAGPPAVALGANTMSYTPSATLNAPTPVTATPALPDSSYGSAGAFSGAPGSVDIPVWWYSILSLTKGINHAIIAGMPSSVGIREVQQQAQLATVSDPIVRGEAGQFYNDCYIPARSKYLRDKPTSAAITGLLSEYGADDPDWMGSHVYRALYYPNMRSRTRVTGWPYKASRDVDYGYGGNRGLGTTHLRRMVAGGWDEHGYPKQDQCPAGGERTAEHPVVCGDPFLHLARAAGQQRRDRCGEAHRQCRAQVTEQLACRGHDDLSAG